MHQLNHHNPEYVTWVYEELNFALLGGIRIEGMHSMRVTLKIDFKTFPSIRHSLDLYNESQTEKLVRKTAERFTLSTSYIHTAVGHLINTVEDYRLTAINNEKSRIKNEQPVLTKEEETEAINFLKGNSSLGDGGLLLTTNTLIGRSGVIGEEQNRLIMFLVFTSRKMPRPLHIISFGSSGAGKSHLQEKVGELIPAEDRIELTSVSGNAFYYYVDDDLGHKLVLIEDYDGVLPALYPIRELQSKQKISKTITVRDRNGNVRTLHLTVRGPVSIGGCTTSEKVYEDNANRSFLIYLDESEAQDEAVMHYQRRLSAGKVDTGEQQKAQRLMQNAQRLLQPITVRNPYAEQLIIPKEVFKPKRSNAHYLAFIETITFYKQYRREHKIDKSTGEIFIETTLEDIQEANELMKNVLLKKADELGYATRNFFEKVKAHLKSSKLKFFTNKALREALKINPGTYKMYMAELTGSGYVRKTEDNKGNQKKGYAYEVVSYEEYGKLQSRINTVLDEVLNKLKAQEAPKNTPVRGKRL
jgi:predicted DNA-binding protein